MIDIQALAPDLDDWLLEHDAGRIVHTYYKTDQADVGRLGQILEDEFGNEPLDLVIDDASHLRAQTVRVSFNTLFPRL